MRSSVQTLTVWRWNPEEKIFPASLRFVNGVGPLSAHADGLTFCLLGVSHLRNALLPSMRKKRRWLRMLCAVILLWKVSGLSSCFSSCSSWLLLGAGTRSLLFICGPQSPLGWHHLIWRKWGFAPLCAHLFFDLCDQQRDAGFDLTEDGGVRVLLLHLLQQDGVDEQALRQPLQTGLLQGAQPQAGVSLNLFRFTKL